MFGFASQSFSFLSGTRSPRTARYFHRVSADFINYDTRGNPVARKVPVIVGNPGETYVLIEPGIDRCKLTFFHDSQYFGFGKLSVYPRLYVPSPIPRQTDSNTSPATLFLSGKMHEIVLDGTFDAKFAEDASATGRNLEHVVEQLKDM
ncbi:hypothetical protein P175DRAFT_0506195 [Aspergillus ochraceoroseus IBT 24754]|uniref:Uncharacterized protein n=1 Tax=Aspergillus ochraceoroseus IBT 24754 TaxID=1392256 RepID=A0A2T5M7S3_9EURO|nr:uncharacterized protein P175DRAFT_0506195 [Aspergillus ochraceoroseus IBT 24754]PTU24567.1 hypothetical protein P175DRAFT_0506195 [Aspergillus ochraceoroseus IBT 24754]